MGIIAFAYESIALEINRSHSAADLAVAFIFPLILLIRCIIFFVIAWVIFRIGFFFGLRLNFFYVVFAAFASLFLLFILSIPLAFVFGFIQNVITSLT